MPPILFLIDGHALAYRTYFALTAGGGDSRWITSAGEPTAGIFGFTSVLLRILEQERPEYLAVAFDTGKTFRDEMYPEYKATREKMPDDLRIQIERIRTLVDTFNIPRLEMENYEADDVLGSVARSAASQGLGVKIFTGDRDLLQLVDDRIIVNLPAGRSLSQAKDYTAEEVFEYLQVRPDQIVDYKAMVGDSSDNIPGVRGIGKKTAERLLADYDTLDNIYEHLDELKPGERTKLESSRSEAYLSRDLALIVTNLEVPLDLDKARSENFSPSAVEALFRDLEFRSLMPRLMKLVQSYGKVTVPSTEQQLSFFPGHETAPVSTVDLPSITTIFVQTPEALAEMVKKLNKAEIIAFDTETTSTDQMQADLVGISLAVEPGAGYYIPVGHNAELGEQLPLDQVLEALRKPLTNPDIPKAGHNLKYDFVILARYGLRVTPLAYDTMIAEWLQDPTSRNLGLKNLSWVRVNTRMTEISELLGKGKTQRTMAEVAIEPAGAYAAADAETVLRLIPELDKDLAAREARQVFDEIEMPLIEVLADMEMVGVELDLEFLSGMSQELTVRMDEISTKIFEVVGEPFNLNSTQQLSVALFNRLQLQPPDRTRKTASGHYSTSASVLEGLRGQHQVVDLVLEYRELAKLRSTYVDALPLQVSPRSGRVHTSYNQTGSVTGRIASSNPNLQNIPIRTELGRRVRRAFVAGPGKVLLAIDYSQVELRIVAHMANDQAMLAAFRADQDIHATTAAAVYGIPLEAVDGEQRRHAKAINFGLIYGMSAFGLTRTTDLTLAEAEDFVEAYFERFPGVKTYLDEIRRLVFEQEYVETLLGRRRNFFGLNNQTNRNIRNRIEREAINAPIQGTAADIMKIAMIQVAQALAASGLQAKLLLQVHDELVLECPQGEVVETARLVQETMENAYRLQVPLRTDARQGKNWGSLQTIP